MSTDGKIHIEMASRLRASRAEVWDWITSVDGITEEMRPYFHMTVPEGVRWLSDFKIELGKPFLHSRVRFFSVVPAGSWDFTLIEFVDGVGFVEQSPSTFMKEWRHQRRILDEPGDPSAVLLQDRVTFVPKGGQFVLGPLLRHVFRHRHRVLQQRFDGANA